MFAELQEQLAEISATLREIKQRGDPTTTVFDREAVFDVNPLFDADESFDRDEDDDPLVRRLLAQLH